MSDPAPAETFADALRRLRTAARMTQEQLAERADLSVRTIRGMESGRIRSPRPESLRLLAGALGFAGDQLTEFEDLGRDGYWTRRKSSNGASPPDQSFPVPAQLPPDVSAFTGRDDHIRELDAVLAGDKGAASRIAVLVGGPGAGKTALAVHWAHRVRRLFPDGQLYLNLAGYSTAPPLSPADALGRVVRALGVAPERIPPDVTEAAGLLRTLLSGTKTLLVLDDVPHAEHVRPLLPGEPGCFVLVTSRIAQRSLVAREGAHQIAVGPLDAVESEELLSSVIGSASTSAEPDAVAELAELCGRLPLALRIAAANLVGRPGRSPVGAFVRRLRSGNRLAALSIAADSETTVRAAFDLSYDALPAQARRLFRLLSLAPDREVTTAAAGALLGDSELAVELLEMLAAAHLVEELAFDRFVQPDLLRLYAAERAVKEEGDAERDAAWARLLRHQLDRLDEAAVRLYPQTARLEWTRTVPEAGLFADHHEALEWLDAELPSLQAAVLVAARSGPRSAAWRISDALRGYFQLRGAVAPWLIVARTALGAADAEGDIAAQAACHLSVAGALARQDRYGDAAEHGEQALTLARAAGWTDGEVAGHRALANLLRLSGRPHDASAHLREALRLADPVQEPGYGSIIEHIARVNHELGILGESAAHYERALELLRASGAQARLAEVLTGLGDVLHGLGRQEEALDRLWEARDLHRDLADRGGEAYNLRCQAEVLRDSGDTTGAMGLAMEALDLATDDDDLRLQAQARETLGSTHLAAGRPDLALIELDAALVLAVRTNNPYTHAQALIGISGARRANGNAEQAVAAAAAALDLARAGSYTLLEGQALTAAAAAELAAGRTDDAAEHARAAVAAHEITGSPAGRLDAEHALREAVTRTRADR
ncbi:ATP-binding protein [Pseudonocardia sp. TRM90224]|uniref:ATP-binding protein n=1 Tax=Pseudonocardia sp. TRM90224 TaxID=2812678 RepID=UPI001E286561|nr:helix-turn-helix domain-containing protein [Pseudonocardia sp. TRM90224]